MHHRIPRAYHSTEAETTTEIKRLSGPKQLSKGQLRSLTVLQPLPTSLAAVGCAIQLICYCFPRGTGLGVHLESNQCSIISRWPRTIAMVGNSWIERIGCRMCRICSIDTCWRNVARNRSGWGWSFVPVRIIRVDLEGGVASSGS